MRVLLLSLAVATTVFVGGWLVDDKMLGADIPRNRSVATIDVGGLDVDDARSRLADAGLDAQPIRLRYGADVVSTTAAALGVVVDRLVEGEPQRTTGARGKVASASGPIHFMHVAQQAAHLFGLVSQVVMHVHLPKEERRRALLFRPAN